MFKLVKEFIAKKDVLFILSLPFLLCTNSLAQTWKELQSAPRFVNHRFEDIYFVNENLGWATGGDLIVKTADGGETWETQRNDLSGRSLVFLDSLRGWVGTLHGKLYQTTNSGQTWEQVPLNLAIKPSGICDMYTVDDSVIVGAGRWSGPAVVIKSNDAGNTWQSFDLSEHAEVLIGCIFFDQDNGFVVGGNGAEGGVVLSTNDGGETWAKKYESRINNEHIWNITFVNDSIGFATTQSVFNLLNIAIIKTVSRGESWTRHVISPAYNKFRYAEAIGFIDEHTGWVACGVGEGIYETNDGGLTWDFINMGSRIHGIYIVNDRVGYAGGRTIYKYTNDSTVDVKVKQSIEKEQNILQNSPNPFNLSTVIHYYLPERSFAWLSVYDLKGKLVATLHKGYQDPGQHSIEWNASNQAAGLYFYSLRTDEGIFYGKAALIK